MILTQDHQGTSQPEEALNRERNLEEIGGRIIDHHQEAQVKESIFHQRNLNLMQKNKNLTSRQKIMFKKKQLPSGSLKINWKVIIWVIKLLLQYLHQTLGSCMKLVSFVQDYLMELLNLIPTVNLLST